MEEVLRRRRRRERLSESETDDSYGEELDTNYLDNRDQRRVHTAREHEGHDYVKQSHHPNHHQNLHHNHHHRQQQYGADGDEGFTQRDHSLSEMTDDSIDVAPEVLQLMRRGYPQREAEEIIRMKHGVQQARSLSRNGSATSDNNHGQQQQQQQQKRRPKGELVSAAVQMLQTTSSADSDEYGCRGEDSEVTLLVARGMSHDEAVLVAMRRKASRERVGFNPISALNADSFDDGDASHVSSLTPSHASSTHHHQEDDEAEVVRLMEMKRCSRSMALEIIRKRSNAARPAASDQNAHGGIAVTATAVAMASHAHGIASAQEIDAEDEPVHQIGQQDFDEMSQLSHQSRYSQQQMSPQRYSHAASDSHHDLHRFGSEHSVGSHHSLHSLTTSLVAEPFSAEELGEVSTLMIRGVSAEDAQREVLIRRQQNRSFREGHPVPHTQHHPQHHPHPHTHHAHPHHLPHPPEQDQAAMYAHPLYNHPQHAAHGGPYPPYPPQYYDPQNHPHHHPHHPYHPHHQPQLMHTHSDPGIYPPPPHSHVMHHPHHSHHNLPVPPGHYPPGADYSSAAAYPPHHVQHAHHGSHVHHMYPHEDPRYAYSPDPEARAQVLQRNMSIASSSLSNSMEAAPATGDSVTQSDGHVVHPGVDDRLPGSSDSKAMRIALLVSKQEELYGKNMYETLTPEDEPELRYLRHHLRMDVDDAILKIYERKGFVVPEIPEAEAIEGAAASSSDSAAGGKGHGPDDGAVATEKDDKKKAKSKGLEKRKTSLLATIFGSDRVMKTHDEGGARIRYRDCDVKKLVKMGFSKDQAVQALLLCDHSVPRAAEVLLGSGGNSHMLSDNR